MVRSPLLYRVVKHVVDLGLVIVLVTISAGLVGRTTVVMQSGPRQ